MLINILLLIFIPKRERENEEGEKIERKYSNNIFTVTCAIFAVIVFILTENI